MEYGINVYDKSCSHFHENQLDNHWLPSPGIQKPPLKLSNLQADTGKNGRVTMQTKPLLTWGPALLPSSAW